MSRFDWWQLATGLAPCTVIALACHHVGPLEDFEPPADEGDVDSDTVDHVDTDTDADTGADTGDCTDIEWGSGLKIGEAVSNWVQTGYIDSNLDGVVEQEEVEFDLDLIRCTGKESMVIVYGDTS